jgi:hypothetical protein
MIFGVNINGVLMMQNPRYAGRQGLETRHPHDSTASTNARLIYPKAERVGFEIVSEEGEGRCRYVHALEGHCVFAK